MKEWLIRFILKLVFTLYPKLYRVHMINAPEDIAHTPIIYAHYHGDELALIPVLKGKGLTTMSRLSRDGRRMADVLHYLGYNVVSGSSSRRSVGALIELKAHAQEHPGPISFAVDGPKGPRHEIKPGLIWLSQKTQVPIVFTHVTCQRKWVFEEAWNKAFIPKPFSKVLITCSDPYIPPKHEDSRALTKQLTTKMQSWSQNPQSPTL